MTEITVTVSGSVGCGKSAIAGEIEIALRAVGVPVRFADEKGEREEKNTTGADWAGYIDMYKPSVVIVEQIDPACQTNLEGPQCCMCGKKYLSTVEGDGGTECELSDGRWVCSAECWDRAVEPSPQSNLRVRPLEWNGDHGRAAMGSYRVSYNANGQPWGSPELGAGYYAERDIGFGQIVSGPHGTRKEAEQAADADHESRVLSAITTEGRL